MVQAVIDGDWLEVNSTKKLNERKKKKKPIHAEKHISNVLALVMCIKWIKGLHFIHN